MEHRKKSTKEDSRENERRHKECLLKFEKIVDQFDDMMDVMDPISQLAKRRRTSKRRVKKKNTSGAGEGSSAAAADEATRNAQVAEKASALEQIITKHLNDLQSGQPLESSS